MSKNGPVSSAAEPVAVSDHAAYGPPPRVSVVMPVYNGAPFLRATLDSFSAQTFTDFEMVAVDDGSSDDSLAILSDYSVRDPRVRVFAHEGNQGHHAASNAAIALARGEFIARHDQDDLALPCRLSAAVEVLEANPDVGLVNSAYLRWLPDGRLIPRHPPTSHTAMRVALLFGNMICHAAVTLRADVFADLDPWYRDLPGPQDYDLWIRVLEQTKGFGIDTPLVVYRQESMAMSAQYSDRMTHAVEELSRDQLRRFVPEEAIQPVRELYALTRPANVGVAVRHLYRLFDELVDRCPDLDAEEVERIRHRWTERALRSTLAPSGTMPRDLRLVASLARHDPVGTLRWMGREMGRQPRSRRRAAPA